MFQSEAKCEAIDMKMSFYFHAHKTNFHKKGFVLSFVLKERVFVTQKWPIKLCFFTCILTLAVIPTQFSFKTSSLNLTEG